MTKSEAIHHRVLRCRPAKRNAYVTTHEALLAEAEYLQQTPAPDNEMRKVIRNGIEQLVVAVVFVIGFAVALGWFA